MPRKRSSVCFSASARAMPDGAATKPDCVTFLCLFWFFLIDKMNNLDKEISITIKENVLGVGVWMDDSLPDTGWHPGG